MFFRVVPSETTITSVKFPWITDALFWLQLPYFIFRGEESVEVEKGELSCVLCMCYGMLDSWLMIIGKNRFLVLGWLVLEWLERRKDVTFWWHFRHISVICTSSLRQWNGQPLIWRINIYCNYFVRLNLQFRRSNDLLPVFNYLPRQELVWWCLLFHVVCLCVHHCCLFQSSFTRQNHFILILNSVQQSIQENSDLNSVCNIDCNIAVCYIFLLG